MKIAEAAPRPRPKADLAFAEAQFQNTLIRAPFTGVVVKKMAEVGESVAPIPPGVTISSASGAIVALADLDTLEVEVDVAEANVAKLTADQPAEVTVEAFPERRYKAALRQVIPTADRTKATVQVKVTILDKDKDLKPEMSACVTFIEPQRKRPRWMRRRPRRWSWSRRRRWRRGTARAWSSRSSRERSGSGASRPGWSDRGNWS